MKLKKLFALALAVCMVLSAAPVSMAGILSNGSSNGSATGGILSNGNSNDSTGGILSSSTPAQQPDAPSSGSRGILSASSGDNVYYTPSTTTSQIGLLSNGPGEEPIGGENTITTLAAPAASNSEKLDNGGGSYAGPSLAEKDYTLSNSAAAVGAANANTSVKVANNKVTLTKNISGPDANGNYTITLGASTESETVTVKSAANIVLVLDASQSMIDDADTLNAAVDKFLRGASSSKDSKVAIISYSNSATVRTNNTSDGTAFLPISVNGSLNSALTDAADAVTTATKATAGTDNVAKLADKGLEKAVDVIHAYNNVYKNDETPVIVVLFTDGVPTKDTTVKSNIWAKTYDAYGIAQDALHWSTILKGTKGNAVLTERTHRDQEFYTPESFFSNDHWSRTSDEVWESMTAEKTNVGCGATVYTVGINIPNYSRGGDGAKINEFMYRASSHVPTSAHSDSGYDYYEYDNSTRNKGYYLVGEMTTDLFNDIQMEGGVSLKNVTLRDVVPDYMEIVGRTTNTVEWKNQSITPGANGALTKTLTVRFKDGFLGGHSVPTNDSTSGLYAVDAATGAETLVGAFGIPTVNVPVPEISTVIAVDKNIYLGKELTDAELLEGVKATYADGGKTFTIDPTKPNFGLESWQTAYTKSIVFSVVDDAKFTLGCTITPNAAQATVYQPVSKTDDATITVFKPHIDFKDSTIYLGEWADFEDNHAASCVEWFAGDDEAVPADMTGTAPSVTVIYDKYTGYFAECTPVSVATVKLNGNEVDKNDVTFLNAGDETDKVQFTVHVVKPVITNSSATIYLGNTIELKGQMSEGLKWTCADKSLDAPTDSSLDVIYDFKKVNQDGTLSAIPAPDRYDPADCTTVAVSATVNGKTAPIANAYQRFTVHVLKPTVTFQDSEIFLSESADYADNLVLVGDNEEQASWACSDDEGSSEEAPPTLIYEYSVKAQDFKVCTPVNVTKVYSDKDKSNTITANDADITSGVTFMNGRDDRTQSTEKFKVHVYHPQIVMTSRPLWNDYNKAAKYAGLVQAVESASISKWLDECKAKAEKAVNSTEITMSEPTYTFKLGEEVIGEDGYKAETYRTTDFDTLTVALNTVKIGGKLYRFDELPEVAPKAFDINVNKFDLTINKTWSGADVYKQDAIFTVSGGLGEFQVVLPKGESNVIVTGLLCGQDYTVTEDDAWTWRWKATKDISFTTHEHDVSTSAPTEHVNLDKTTEEDTTSVSFTNKLIEKLGELWLSFCTTVKNIFAAVTTTEGGN